MGPAQVLRLRFWGAVLAFVTSGALTAGVAYGILGSDVTRNSEDIATLRAQQTIVTDIRLAQRTASAERGELKSRLDRISRILERQYGIPSGG